MSKSFDVMRYSSDSGSLAYGKHPELKMTFYRIQIDGKVRNGLTASTNIGRFVEWLPYGREESTHGNKHTDTFVVFIEITNN